MAFSASDMFQLNDGRVTTGGRRSGKNNLETADEAVEAYMTLRARHLLIAGADRDQNTTKATRGRNRAVVVAGIQATFP